MQTTSKRLTLKTSGRSATRAASITRRSMMIPASVTTLKRWLNAASRLKSMLTLIAASRAAANATASDGPRAAVNRRASASCAIRSATARSSTRAHGKARARLALTAEIGIVEAFRNQLAAGAAALRIKPFGFNLLPCRQRVDNPVELLAAPGFWKMLQLFDADHDFILFDSSPLLEMGDSTLLAKFTDTTLMVVQSGALKSAEMARAIAPFTPEDLLGVVLNRMK